MEYQKIESTPNKRSKFRTKNSVEINDKSRGKYDNNSHMKCNTSMLRSSLCDYSDAYILVSVTITVAVLAAGGGNNNMLVVFKNCALFTNCITEINNTQIDNAKYLDVIMPMHNLIEYSDNYSKNHQIYGNTMEMSDTEIWSDTE